MAKRKPAKKSNVKKAPVKPVSLSDTINTEVIAAALSSANTPVLLKACRLCEAKDGPFLNIFDADKVTAKKIEVVMPFRIEENDDLPHKICFRCSAKVEELYEFIQKCIKTQTNLRKVVGNKGIGAKTKHREQWEEKLNQSNISNDDICDALIKKAMEGIKDIPLSLMSDVRPMEEEKTSIAKMTTNKTPTVTVKEEHVDTSSNKSLNEIPKDDIPITALVNEKITEKDDDVPVKRTSRSSFEKKVEENDIKPTKSVDVKETSRPYIKNKPDTKVIEEPPTKEGLKLVQSLQTNNFTLEEALKTETVKTDPEQKPFDIMDHVSMIQVNGVGVLFQCKMCNRNFLKKEVVMSHACAKHGSVKIQGPKSFVPPNPPKVPQTVKYITMTVNKEATKPTISNAKPKLLENKIPESLNEPINLDDEDDDKPLVVKVSKPKIGPASKVKRNDAKATSAKTDHPLAPSPGQPNQLLVGTTPGNAILNITPNVSSDTKVPSVQFPFLPSLNSRYKLMPGPNNTFTLVEEKNTEIANKTTEPVTNTVSLKAEKTKPGPKSLTKNLNSTGKSVEKPAPVGKNPSDVQSSPHRPYPVGLIKSISASNSSVPVNPEPGAFPTPAMKKQSYTVVQTGNPSKLLISTKPQPPPPEEEVPKKRQKKTKNVVKEKEVKKQPFSVTIEDAAPPADPSFFTFINVDPLLQPSYVLPTHNIIQESQISTSSNVLKQIDDKDKYTCNMCNEKFSRQKKLEAHIHSHYSKMDEEDLLRTEKNPKKRGRK